MLKRVKARAHNGFTLLELLIVVAILATLAAIAVPVYREFVERAKRTVAIGDIKNIERNIGLFETEIGRLPGSLAEAGLERKDPWGQPYQYILIRDQPLTGKGKISPRKDRNLRPINSDYDLWSNGPDGKFQLPLTAKASHDDILRGGDGSFIGVAKDF